MQGKHCKRIKKKMKMIKKYEEKLAALHKSIAEKISLNINITY